MLEHRVLLVRPARASAVQVIDDGDSGAPLGFVRRVAAAPASWWPSFGRPILAVHEHEDEPLLFTIRRAWSLLPRREVCDADGSPVGSLLGRFVQDRHGRTLAALQGNNGGGSFRSPTHHTLAEWTATAEGMRIEFGPEIIGEPFVKMLLLAAALEIGRP
jgi:hypothetical protein